VDVNVYFTTDASEADILALRDKLDAEPPVQSVEYVSKEEALEEFRANHSEDESITAALDELGGNPLRAYFNVSATETSDYQQIADYLESDAALTSAGTDIVDEVNFFRNKEAIDRLTSIINSVNTLSLGVMILFMLISILIIFNTVRLAIYTAREEISVMKLVGASNSYVRGPFIVEGIMYGIVSALFALVLFYPLTLWVGPSTELFFGEGSSIFDWFINNFSQLFLILITVGAALGAISSFLAVKKYLKV
jgi:cell division transport system permease protein